MAIIGCSRTSFESQNSQGRLDFQYAKLKTAEDVQLAVDEATAKPNCILFVHVSWAPMEHLRQRFWQFKNAFEIQYPISDLQFAYIDCSAISGDYKPFRLLPGWKELEDQNNGQSLVHGYGELVWFKNGVVLHVESPDRFESTDSLIAKTKSLGMCSNAAK